MAQVHGYLPHILEIHMDSWNPDIDFSKHLRGNKCEEDLSPSPSKKTKHETKIEQSVCPSQKKLCLLCKKWARGDTVCVQHHQVILDSSLVMGCITMLIYSCLCLWNNVVVFNLILSCITPQGQVLRLLMSVSFRRFLIISSLFSFCSTSLYLLIYPFI